MKIMSEKRFLEERVDELERGKHPVPMCGELKEPPTCQG